MQSLLYAIDYFLNVCIISFINFKKLILIAGLTEEEIQKAVKLSGVSDNTAPVLNQRAIASLPAQPSPPGKSGIFLQKVFFFK